MVVPSTSIEIDNCTPITVTARDQGIAGGIAGEEETGVQFVQYRYYPQGGQVPDWTTVSGPRALFFLIGADGVYRLEFRSADNVGNIEAARGRPVVLRNIGLCLGIG
jgi:hypothetical protein